MPDFIHHKNLGVIRACDWHSFRYAVPRRISLTGPIEARYLSDWSDPDDMPPGGAAPAAAPAQLAA